MATRGRFLSYVPEPIVRRDRKSYHSLKYIGNYHDSDVKPEGAG